MPKTRVCSQCKEEGHTKRSCPKNETDLFKVEVVLSDGSTFESEGATVQEALDGLKLNYTQIKSKGEIILTKGGKTAKKLFYLRPMRRAVANKIRKAQIGRDLESLLQ